MKGWPFPLPPRLNLHIPLHSTTKHSERIDVLYLAGWQGVELIQEWVVQEASADVLIFRSVYLWAATRMRRGPAQSRASSSHVLLCNRALQRPLCVSGTVHEIIWILCIFTCLNVCMCFLFVYIPPLCEKAKPTNVIYILFFGLSLNRVPAGLAGNLNLLLHF